MSAPPLEVILRNVSITGRIHAITCYQIPNGKWQVSAQKKKDDGWRVCIDTDLLVALTNALGPTYTQSWDDVMKQTSTAVIDLL